MRRRRATSQRCFRGGQQPCASPKPRGRALHVNAGCGPTARVGCDHEERRPQMTRPFVIVLTLAVSACATPAQMHTEAQLNAVALGCGLALGELIQDEM